MRHKLGVDLALEAGHPVAAHGVVVHEQELTSISTFSHQMSDPIRLTDCRVVWCSAGGQPWPINPQRSLFRRHGAGSIIANVRKRSTTFEYSLSISKRPKLLQRTYKTTRCLRWAKPGQCDIVQ